jgi:glucose dehydrogenase
MNWYFQFTPGDMWDYDEVGTHILIDGVVAGQPRKLITHSARNGFLYTMDRFNGQTVLAKPYTEVNWTKGIDQRPASRSTTIPTRTSRPMPASAI